LPTLFKIRLNGLNGVEEEPSQQPLPARTRSLGADNNIKLLSDATELSEPVVNNNATGISNNVTVSSKTVVVIDEPLPPASPQPQINIDDDIDDEVPESPPSQKRPTKPQSQTQQKQQQQPPSEQARKQPQPSRAKQQKQK